MLIRSSLLLIRLSFLFFMQKYVNADAQRVDVNIGGCKAANITHALIMAMLATAILDHLFIKSNILAMDRLVVVKFRTNIANRWLFMTEKNGYHSVFIKLF